MEVGPVRTHEGSCDASAAVFISTMSHKFLVADDEDQHHTRLRLYDADRDGPPLEVFHLDNSCLRPDPEEPEIDIEASAWLDGCVYWIGSHSRSKKGKKRLSRQRLFATKISETGEPTIVGQPYETLISDVALACGLDLDPKLPPKEGGLSIEGLASAPDGELLIGLRSPLFHKKALLLPLLNPADVVTSGAKAEFGVAMMLDLDGKGIRSIDYWPARHSHYILAGPAGSGSAADFCLYRWSGSLATKPEGYDRLDFTKLGIGPDAAAEALLIQEAEETVYVVFDEGNRMVGDVPCKESPHQSFHTISLMGL
jgi:hypothetical protein